MRPLYPLLPLAVALAVVGSARAQSLSVPLDHAERLSVVGAAANVVVGNPQIADVTVVDSHTLYVMGRGYGTTGLNVTDAAGRTLFAGEVAVVRPSSAVSVYRGVTRTEFDCARACAEAHGGAGAGGAAAGGSAAPSADSPASAMAASTSGGH